jgi:hypothetical protein
MSGPGATPTLREVVSEFENRRVLPLQLFEHAVLIHCGGAITDFPGSSTGSFDTRAAMAPWDARVAIALVRSGLKADPELLSKADAVYAVKKRPGGPFPDRIGLGRSRTADIPLRITSVSKYHAYFTYDEAQGLWTLWDARSRNGTYVGPTRLTSGAGAPVANGEHVAFSEESFLFFTNEGFRNLVAMLAQSAPGRIS